MNDPKKNDNVPPNSRLFIVCGKSVTEDDFKETFGAFGQVDAVQLHKDRKGDSKGIAYIKFSKTSEAARAVEEMNGRCLGQHPRPLKVMIANSKEQGNGRECNEEERLLRLFVVVAKDKAEEELKNYFDSFGTVQYVNIVRDRETKESKGFAYIKFYRLIHAAAAFELCEKSYKAVFAEPRPQRPQAESHGRNQLVNPLQHLNNGFRNNRTGSSLTSQVGRAESCRLTVTGSSAINEDQLWRLFDLIPGLDYCEVREVCQSAHRIVGLAVYTSPAAAAYARKKLHGFEYPPGQRLIVRYEEGGVFITTPSPAASTPPPSLPLPGDLQSLADSIAHATSLLQAANLHDREGGAPPLHYPREGGVAPHHYPREGGVPPHHYPPPVTPLTIPVYDPAYCSISLPSPQPLVPMETTVGERLFLVCTPSPPPLYALKDVFSRFGGLIDVYLLQGKRCGYALFSSSEAAEEAKTALNGQEVMGVRVKVLLAEPSRNMEREQDRSPLA